MKNAFEELISRLNIVEERISEPGNISVANKGMFKKKNYDYKLDNLDEVDKFL